MALPAPSTTSPNGTRRLRLLLPLLVVAFSAWAFNGWQARRSPAERHIRAAEQFLEQGRGADAEREWKSAVRLNPQDAVTWELLGDYYIAIKNWQPAIDALSQAQKLAPKTPNLDARLADALTNRIDALMRTRADDDLSFQYLNRLAKLRAHDEPFLEYLNRNLMNLRRYEEVLPFLNRLLELSPENALAYSMRGEARLELAVSKAQFKAAETDLRRALELDSGNARTHLNLGRLLLGQGQPREAINHLEIAGQAPQTGSVYLSSLSKAYQRLGNSAKAAALSRQFASERQLEDDIDALSLRLRFQSDNFEDNLKVSELLLRSRNPRGVEKRLQKAQQLRPNDARLKEVLKRREAMYQQLLQSSLVAARKRDFKQADTLLVRAKLLNSDDPRTANTEQLLISIVQSQPLNPPSIP